MIRRNKTPPTGAGIRPFLSGLYYLPEKILTFSSFQSNFQAILISYLEVFVTVYYNYTYKVILFYFTFMFD